VNRDKEQSIKLSFLNKLNHKNIFLPMHLNKLLLKICFKIMHYVKESQVAVNLQEG